MWISGQAKTLLMKLGFGFVLASFLCLYQNPVHALSASDWQPGRIMDDTVFTDSTSMSVGDIQAFLNNRVPICDTWGTQPSELGGGTRAQYAASRGYSTPFTCLKEYYEVPKTTPGPEIPASNYGGKPIPAGAKSAAQLIWDAARKHNISPKVLLVKIEKESAGPLTSDDWPLSKQYLYAMGAHCPDSGPGGSANCDPNYAGFSIQIDESAALMRWYLDSMTQPWWQYKKPFQTNSILWNVAETGCGAGDVYISTKATAALYTYTPYQPNAAALNNMYGTGDGCSAYGNRNFWRVYNEWFGSALAPSYSWGLVSQEAYADSDRTRPLNTGMLSPSTRYYFRVKVTNTGNREWVKGSFPAINLATTNPSQFCDTSWLNCSRPATVIESSVKPGEIGTFEFSMTTPVSYGSFAQYFSLVAEGKEWMNDIGMHWPLVVSPPKYMWSLDSQKVFSDSARTREVNMAALSPDTTYYATVTALNTGNTEWKNSGPNLVNLGTAYPIDRSSAFCDSSWLGCNRAASVVEPIVGPGDIGTFQFALRTPSQLGTYNEYFRPVAEGKDWMNDLGMHLPLSVKPPTYSWAWQDQAAYTDHTKANRLDTSSVTNTQRVFLVLKALNTGNTVWKNSGPNPINLGTAYPADRKSSFCDPSWLTCNRAATLKESSVNPGEVGTFEFYVTVPYSVDGTVLHEYFRPVAEGKDWMNDLGQFWAFKVNSPDYTWGHVDQAIHSDASRTNELTSSSTLQPSKTYYFQLRAKNTGGQIWSKGLINLATSSPIDRQSIFCDPSWLTCNRAATLKESSVNPGEVGTFEFSVKTPATSGTWNEYFRPVAEGKDWMNDLGQFWALTVR